MKPVGTNGLGEPRFKPGDVPTGSIVRFGIDDDMTALVVANFRDTVYLGDGKGGTKKTPSRHLVLLGCFCDELDSYERGKLLHHNSSDPKETLTVLWMPEYS